MFKVTQVKPMPNYQLWISFNDGVKGVVDLSRLAGNGVFEFWNDPENFKKVVIGDSGELIWGNQIDLCPDSLYLQLTHKHPDDVFPLLKMETSHA